MDVDFGLGIGVDMGGSAVAGHELARTHLDEKDAVGFAGTVEMDEVCEEEETREEEIEDRPSERLDGYMAIAAGAESDRLAAAVQTLSIPRAQGICPMVGMSLCLTRYI